MAARKRFIPHSPSMKCAWVGGSGDTSHSGYMEPVCIPLKAGRCGNSTVKKPTGHNRNLLQFDGRFRTNGCFERRKKFGPNS